MAMNQYLQIPFLHGCTSLNPRYFDVNRRETKGSDPSSDMKHVFFPSFPRKHIFQWNSWSAHLSSFFNHFSIESKSEALCQQPPRPDSPEVLCADNAWRDGTFGLNWNDLSEFFGNDLRTSQIYCKIIEYQIYIYVYSVIMLWILFLISGSVTYIVVSALWRAIQSDFTCVDSFIVGALIPVPYSWAIGVNIPITRAESTRISVGMTILLASYPNFWVAYTISTYIPIWSTYIPIRSYIYIYYIHIYYIPIKSTYIPIWSTYIPIRSYIYYIHIYYIPIKSTYIPIWSTYIPIRSYIYILHPHILYPH